MRHRLLLASLLTSLIALIGTVAPVRAAAPMNATTLLKALGYTPLPGGTPEKVRMFQAVHDLPVSGLADAVTLKIMTAESSNIAIRPVSVVVELSRQRAATLDAAGKVLVIWPVSTGKGVHKTPAGSFQVRARLLLGSVSATPGVHMDYFTLFNGNIGFHGIPWKNTRTNRFVTPLGRMPASHGCIRMPDGAARVLFERLRIGSEVRVVQVSRTLSR